VRIPLIVNTHSGDREQHSFLQTSWTVAPLARSTSAWRRLAMSAVGTLRLEL
jgi:hypothetical protein